MPPGYHVEERARKALLITGLAMGGGTYTVSVLLASRHDTANATRWLFLPVAGPWFTLGFRRKCPATSSSSNLGCIATDDTGAVAVLVIDGLAQAAAAALIAFGLALPRMVLVRDDTATVELAPRLAGRNGHGLQLLGTF